MGQAFRGYLRQVEGLKSCGMVLFLIIALAIFAIVTILWNVR